MIEVIHPGLLTTVQDAGRFGHLAKGIPPNGAMDRFALRAANALLGNDVDEAVLEMHFTAGVYRFHADAVICLGGADFQATLNGHPVPCWKPINVAAGGELGFGGLRGGFRAVLAAWGGFDLPTWLGSRSTNLLARAGGFEGRALRAGDSIGLRNIAALPQNAMGWSAMGWSLSTTLIDEMYRERRVRIVAGPEFEWLSAEGRQVLSGAEFTITHESNRTGYRLRGRVVARIPDELVSGAVTFGTLQLPASGDPILLMADHPATGGYPRIAQVISADLPYLAQRRPGDVIRFTLVQQEEAEQLHIALESELKRLSEVCSARMQAWLRASI